MAENTQADVKKLSFERAIEELESIVKRLEDGKVPLEESVTIYERGEALKRRCEELLRQAEARVDKITTDANGRYSVRGLRVGGPYLITVTRAGTSERRDDVFLSLAETLNLDLSLGAPAGSTVIVTGRADTASRMDSSAMGAGTGPRELSQ